MVSVGVSVRDGGGARGYIVIGFSVRIRDDGGGWGSWG